MTVDPNDPFAQPPAIDETSGEDWLRANVPPEWLSAAAGQQAAPAPAPGDVQPGLGVPAAAVSDAIAAPPAPSPEHPTIGFPHDPGPIIEQDAPPNPPDLGELPPDFVGTAPTQLQPGIGVPASALDAGLQAGPDAISGGDLTPIAQGGVVDPFAPPHGEQLTPEQRARQFAASTPEEQARQQVAYEQGFEREQRARVDKVLLDDAQRQAEIHGAITRAQEKAAAATAQLDADAKKQAETPIDNSWHASFLETVGGVIAAFAGGLVQNLNGGRNLGLEAIDNKIARQQEAQKMQQANQRAELQRRGASIQEQLALASAQHEEDTRFRVAGLTTAMNQIASDMQQYAPDGKTAIQLGQMYSQIGQARQKALVDFQDKNFKDQVAVLKAQADQQKAYDDHYKTLAETAKFQAETAKLGKGVGGGGATTPVYGSSYKSLNDVPEKFRKFAFRLPGKNGQPGDWAVANNEKNAEDATHVSQLYAKADYDANELEKISLQRGGLASTAGKIRDGWKDTDEQHYKQLVVDLANVYGMLIHGRAPTAGVLEEVMAHSAPELKPFYDRGDTTALLDHFRNDIDNRTSLTLQTYGANVQVRSDRPKIEQPNINTITAPLTEKPVKGANGYARLDVANFNDALKQAADQYVQNPTLGDNEDIDAHFAKIATAQRQAAQTIATDIAAFEAKKKRTPKEEELLRAAKLAYGDRVQAVQSAEDARKTNVEDARKKQYHQQKQEELDASPSTF